MSAIWIGAAGLACVASLFVILRLVAPSVLGLLLGSTPSPKFTAAALIYTLVIGLGSRHLLEGLGLLNREQTMITEVNRCTDKIEKGSVVGRAEVFGAGNPFVPEGYDRLMAADQTATYKLIAAIRRDGERGRFDPVNLMVERVADQILGGSSGNRDSQQFGVRLGILGTFIGILFSLNGVSGIIGGAAVTQINIQNSIRDVVGSLGVAFATSIAGLLSAILLQVMAGSLRGKEANVIERLHRIAANVQGICRIAARDGDQHQLEAALKDHRQTIHGFVKDLNLGADKIGQSVSAVTLSMDRPLEAIKQQGMDLDGALRRQGDAISSLARIAEGMRTLEGALAASQKQGMERFSDAVEALTERLIAEIRTGYGLKAHDDLRTHLDRSADRQYQAVASMARDFRRAMIFSGVILILVIASARCFPGDRALRYREVEMRRLPRDEYADDYTPATDLVFSMFAMSVLLLALFGAGGQAQRLELNPSDRGALGDQQPPRSKPSPALPPPSDMSPAETSPAVPGSAFLAEIRASKTEAFTDATNHLSPRILDAVLHRLAETADKIAAGKSNEIIFQIATGMHFGLDPARESERRETMVWGEDLVEALEKTQIPLGCIFVEPLGDTHARGAVKRASALNSGSGLQILHDRAKAFPQWQAKELEAHSQADRWIHIWARHVDDSRCSPQTLLEGLNSVGLR